MATGYIFLYPGGFGGDNTSGSANATEELQVSSTAAGSNKPKLHRCRLNFDASTDQHRWFQFKVPGDYASGGTLRGSFATTATDNTKKVVWKAGIGEASSDNSNDGFNAADTNGTGTADSATANLEVEFTIDLTMTSIVANDPVVIFFGRDADDATNDTVTVAASLYELTLEYVKA